MKEKPYPEGWTIGKEDWHFARRLFERYGLTLESGELSRLRKQIRKVRGGRRSRSANLYRRRTDSHDSSWEQELTLTRIREGGSTQKFTVRALVGRLRPELRSALPPTHSVTPSLGAVFEEFFQLNK